ncbi:hypothetical protein [Paenibacillus tyrfis]|uniref:hypothetical protein n=1 Tax=Paenibacillus tyrfis TaxID=1501230 RepID=UPI00209F206B|nr:hypothetical protein [Paenibacillus tyrfis]MCP1311847.1 hypothetical protein [Paenibacillus tyrfis]
MKPEEREPREITYRIGWKRGTIVPNGQHPPAAASGHSTDLSIIRESRMQRWNRSYLWRKAPSPGHRTLQVAVFAMPVLLFALFLWMVYELALHAR